MNNVVTGLVVLTLAMALPAAPLLAQWNWLRDAPANFLTEEDWKILESQVDQVLEAGEDGTEVAWHNPETGHRGTITPLDTSDSDGVSCRNTRVFNSAGGVTNTGTYRFCRQADGTWKITR